MRPVDVLLTCDIHTHHYSATEVHEDLGRARKTLRQLRRPCTFFFPANSAELLREDVAGLLDEGHEIGCHGLTHQPDEQYNRLPLDTQRALLSEATRRLLAVSGKAPVSFRSPTFKVSGDTMCALEELGYRADVSINAQRLPIFGSDLYNVRPMFSPRRPYHPARRDAFRRGDAKVWEIPVSAFALPFVSNTERLLGLGFVKAFFRGLHAEARATGKPIIFMFHAEELNATRPIEKKPPLGWRHFVPSPTYGLRFRELLFESDWRKVARDIGALLEWMASFPAVRFSTVSEYVSRLDAREQATENGLRRG
jgi:polysaccharide deacetylase